MMLYTEGVLRRNHFSNVLFEPEHRGPQSLSGMLRRLSQKSKQIQKSCCPYRRFLLQKYLPNALTSVLTLKGYRYLMTKYLLNCGLKNCLSCRQYGRCKAISIHRTSAGTSGNTDWILIWIIWLWSALPNMNVREVWREFMQSHLGFTALCVVPLLRSTLMKYLKAKGIHFQEKISPSPVWW